MKRFLLAPVTSSVDDDGMSVRELLEGWDAA